MSRITDPSQFGRVAVLMGGDSSEREVSLASGNNVLAALRQRGIDAAAVDGVPALLGALQAKRFDRVFNILHGGQGENGVLQGLLDALAVPYTGSGVLGSALAMDKLRSKQVWIALGLHTPGYVQLRGGDDAQGCARVAGGRMPEATGVRAAAHRIGLPVIVKPSAEGSSVGVSRVFDEGGLDAAVELARRYRGELLMEQLIEGEELTVAILGDEALPSIRIVPAGEYYDYHAKYVAEDTRYLCPGLDGDAEARLRRLALDAHRAIGCRGWSRVDVMRDRAGRFFLLEVNTAPGMTTHSLVPKAAAQVGIDFPELCWRILETSLPEVATA